MISRYFLTLPSLLSLSVSLQEFEDVCCSKRGVWNYKEPCGSFYSHSGRLMACQPTLSVSPSLNKVILYTHTLTHTGIPLRPCVCHCTVFYGVIYSLSVGKCVPMHHLPSITIPTPNRSEYKCPPYSPPFQHILMERIHIGGENTATLSEDG